MGAITYAHKYVLKLIHTHTHTHTHTFLSNSETYSSTDIYISKTNTQSKYIPIWTLNGHPTHRIQMCTHVEFDAYIFNFYAFADTNMGIFYAHLLININSTHTHTHTHTHIYIYIYTNSSSGSSSHAVCMDFPDSPSPFVPVIYRSRQVF